MPDQPMTQRDVEALRGTIARLEQTLERLMVRVEDTYVRRDVLEPRLQSIEEKLRETEEWRTWAQRLVMGFIVLAVLGALVAQTGAVK